MKSKIVSVLALVAALALLLVLALTNGVRVTERGGADQTPLSGSGAAEPSRDDISAKSLPQASQITFTPVVTLRLPLVFNNWGPCSVVPTLVYPPDGLNLATIAPKFRWDSGDNPRATRLRLRVSEDPEFDSWVQGLVHPSAQGEASFRFHENLKPDTTYYWRAWLVCDDLESPYSEVWSFRTGVEGTVPSAPTLTAPVNGIAVSSPSVTLVWESVDGAVEYLLRYREVSAGGYRWVWTSDTRVTLDLDADKIYEWWVAAFNGYAIGQDSEIWRFTTTAVPAAAPQDAEDGVAGQDGERITIETP
jgi:hypothetical protein